MVAGPTAPALGGAPASFPLAFMPPSPDLTYIGIDATAFDGFDAAANARYVNDESGAGANVDGVIAAPLVLPSGSVVRSVSVAYVGSGHRIQLWRRRMTEASTLDTAGPMMVLDEMLPDQGAGSHAETFTTSYTVAADSTYSLRSPVTAGQSILGVTVGYTPRTQGFVPIDPPERPFDTRRAAQGPKLQAEEPRTVDLELPAGAKGAVLNLTITETESSFGFVSVYRAGIDWPENSSINWSSPGLSAANTVITAVDDQGRVAVRAGEAPTHAIIDVIGYLI